MELKVVSADRLVFLQFSFGSAKVVPSQVRQIDDEGLDTRVQRKIASGGEQIIPPTPVVDVSELPTALFDQFVLVDAWRQLRLDRKHVLKGKTSNVPTYHVVRFTFCRSIDVIKVNIQDEEFEGVCAALMNIVGTAFWRVRAYRNPDFQHPGRNVVSVNMEVREPLFLPDGKPVVRWERDENGQKVGDVPKLLQPKDQLIVV